VVVGNDASTTTVRTSFRSAPRDNLTFQLSGSYVDRSVNSLNYRQLFQLVDVQQTEPDYAFKSVDDALKNGNRTATDVSRIYAGATLSWEPFPIWQNRLTVGMDNSFELNETVGIGTVSSGIARDRIERRFDRQSLNLVSSVSYPREGFLTSTFSVGMEGFRDDIERLRFRGINLPSRDVSDFDLAEDITGGGSTTIPSDLSSRTLAFGAFAQEMIGLGDKAYITLGIRADGNSAFGDDYGIQAYPKVSGTYLLKPMQNWDTKLRAAWGRSGKAPQPFAKDLIFLIQRNLQDQPIERLSNPGNPLLKPELGSEIEVGFDQFFGTRGSLSFTYFHQTTRNALLTGPVPMSTGFSTGPLANIGELRSQGIEMSSSINLRPFQGADMRVGVTLSHMIENGVVVSLGDVYSYLSSNSQSSAWRALQGVSEGESIRDLSYATPWTRTTEDVFGDYVVTGSRVPKTTGGLNVNLTLADRLRFNTQMIYGFGGKAFDYVLAQRDSRYGFTQMCCWYVPEVADQRYVFSTDHVKMSMARVAYVLPGNIVQSFARDGEFYIEGQNLFSWDLFERGDPETSATGSHSQGATGTFNYAMPLPQRYVLGLRLTSGGSR
jgi:TonB-dependent starch-binding outer membrane protein SusC